MFQDIVDEDADHYSSAACLHRENNTSIVRLTPYRYWSLSAIVSDDSDEITDTASSG